jgi:hypothetical protein
MSFHLAHPYDPESGKALSPALKEMGLSYLRAKPCDVQVLVLPIVAQPGYACYVMNLPAFMEATLTGKCVLISNRGYPVGHVPHKLPWKLPNLIYDFPRTPKNNVIETLRTHSEMVDGRNKSKSFIMQNVTLTKVQQLVANNREIQSKTAHIIGTVNLDGMKVILMVQKVLSAFLLTHIYPAFRHVDDAKASGGNIEVVVKKRKVSSSSYIACITNAKEAIEDPMSEEEGVASAAEQVPPGHGIVLTRAKPTPISGAKWGTSAEIPNSSGIYVPYVKALAVPECVTVPELFSTTFLKALGSTNADMFTTADQIRRAWGVISTTDIGLEVTHLCKCIHIALQAQATVFPIYTGDVYEGAVLSGAGYSVCVKGRVYEPIAYADLQQMVEGESMHSKAVAELASLLVSATVPLEYTSIRGLSIIAKGVALDEIAKQQVVKVAYNLSFTSDKYWSTNPTFVQKALGYLLKPDEVIPSDVPMHPKYIFTSDRVEEVMSAFGHQAPTFMIPNGAKRSFDDEDPPKNFLVRTTTTEVAIYDMKSMLEIGYITNDVGNLSSKHRDVPLRGAIKDEVWKKLRELHSCSHEVPTVSHTSGVPLTRAALDDDLW